MTPSHEERILAFLSGELPTDAREGVLAEIERSPDFAAEVRAAARGLEAVRAWGGTSGVLAGGATHGPARDSRSPRRIPAWSLPLAVAATIAATVPATLMLSSSSGTRVIAPTPTLGPPQGAAPSFVVVLQGTWPDRAEVAPTEQRRRADEYWAWADQLAQQGVLVAAGDLRWEPGLRVASSGVVAAVSDETVADPDFLVGMFTVRADSYEEALAIAEQCPHLRYGGSVSVRQVAGGFVTVPGMDDWAG